MKKRLLYAFVVLAFSLSTVGAFADMVCRPGHVFHFDEGPMAGQWACNPGGDSCLHCEDEIFVLG